MALMTPHLCSQDHALKPSCILSCVNLTLLYIARVSYLYSAVVTPAYVDADTRLQGLEPNPQNPTCASKVWR